MSELENELRKLLQRYSVDVEEIRHNPEKGGSVLQVTTSKDRIKIPLQDNVQGQQSVGDFI